MSPYAAQTMSGDPTEIAMIEGEPRISDRRLNRALGFTRGDNLRRLIRTRADELEDFGRIFLFEEKNSGRGRPRLIYWLNEHQATAICLWAETPKARAARRLIVEVFTAWRTGGELPPAPASGADRFEANASRAATAAAHVASVEGVQSLAHHVTYLPIWSNGRRPKWWSNLPLRSLLTELHRQVMLDEAVEEAERQFGAGCTSRSSVARYWARLDAVRGPVPLADLPRLPAPRRRLN